jgi:hypothetical protein
MTLSRRAHEIRGHSKRYPSQRPHPAENDMPVDIRVSGGNIAFSKQPLQATIADLRAAVQRFGKPTNKRQKDTLKYRTQGGGVY